MADTLLVGETGIFQETPTPPGAAFPPGTTFAWTSSDVTQAAVTTPDPDATGVTVPVTGVAAGAPTLICTATLPGGNVVQSTPDIITVSAPAPPVPTGMTVTKISG